MEDTRKDHPDPTVHTDCGCRAPPRVASTSQPTCVWITVVMASSSEVAPRAMA